MTTLIQVQQFKKAAEKLQRRVEAGDFEKEDSWSCGICCMLMRITGESVNTYGVMSGLLTAKEYDNGLGVSDDFNTDREVFLEFLAYTLSAEDIQEICE